jgi:hypothetical protein
MSRRIGISFSGRVCKVFLFWLMFLFGLRDLLIVHIFAYDLCVFFSLFGGLRWTWCLRTLHFTCIFFLVIRISTGANFTGSTVLHSRASFHLCNLDAQNFGNAENIFVGCSGRRRLGGRHAAPAHRHGALAVTCYIGSGRGQAGTMVRLS